jgi:hypothetical protein
MSKSICHDEICIHIHSANHNKSKQDEKKNKKQNQNQPTKMDEGTEDDVQIVGRGLMSIMPSEVEFSTKHKFSYFFIK